MAGNEPLVGRGVVSSTLHVAHARLSDSDLMRKLQRNRPRTIGEHKDSYSGAMLAQGAGYRSGAASELVAWKFWSRLIRHLNSLRRRNGMASRVVSCCFWTEPPCHPGCGCGCGCIFVHLCAPLYSSEQRHSFHGSWAPGGSS